MVPLCECGVTQTILCGTKRCRDGTYKKETMARMCEHGRQFANCGDCWNNRCDVCGATLDSANDCIVHGIRENPKGPLAEEDRKEKE